MLKIGDFSRLVQVSVKTLRYYDEMKLLKPAWVDRFTGYRYYTPEQIPRLHTILALKELGLSLEQIRRLLRQDLPPSELRGMLRTRYAELERQVEEGQLQLARVSSRLRELEQVGRVPNYSVILKSQPEQRVIGIRSTLATYAEIPDLVVELRELLSARGLAVESLPPACAIAYDSEYRDHDLDVAVVIPLSRAVPGNARANVYTLPAVATLACIIHQGSYDTLSEAYCFMLGWLESQGYRMDGPPRDLYLRGPEAGLSPAHYLTEVQIPITKKQAYILKKEQGPMEPKLVTKEAFMVVGMKYHGKNEHQEIAEMWGQFMARVGEIRHAVAGENSYGMCAPAGADGAFDYVAGIAVDSAEDVPEGMVCWEVPAQTYAVFPCTLPTIGEAYRTAAETWLPQSPYRWGDGPDFELYDAIFNPEEEGSILYIYVPVVKK